MTTTVAAACPGTANAAPVLPAFVAESGVTIVWASLHAARAAYALEPDVLVVDPRRLPDSHLLRVLLDDRAKGLAGK